MYLSQSTTTLNMFLHFLITLGFYINSVATSPIIVVTRFDEDFPQYDAVSGTPFKNCGGPHALVKSVQVIPCDTKIADHCVLNRGGNATFEMSFLSKENSKTLQAKLYGIIDYIPVPFPCPQPNACENSGISCPIMVGHLYNYTLSAPVSTKYPRTSLWIKGELKDDNGNILVCVEIPVRIE